MTEAQEIMNQIFNSMLNTMTNAGLCVCNKSDIPDHHPGLIENNDRVLQRIEEFMGLQEYNAEMAKRRETLPQELSTVVLDAVNDMCAEKDDGACPDEECSGGIVDGICSYCEDEWAYKIVENS